LVQVLFGDQFRSLALLFGSCISKESLDHAGFVRDLIQIRLVDNGSSLNRRSSTETGCRGGLFNVIDYLTSPTCEALAPELASDTSGRLSQQNSIKHESSAATPHGIAADVTEIASAMTRSNAAGTLIGDICF
jgi:hypothetical protein